MLSRREGKRRMAATMSVRWITSPTSRAETAVATVSIPRIFKPDLQIRCGQAD
jgi:hypothetical protein